MGDGRCAMGDGRWAMGDVCEGSFVFFACGLRGVGHCLCLVVRITRRYFIFWSLFGGIRDGSLPLLQVCFFLWKRESRRDEEESGGMERVGEAEEKKEGCEGSFEIRSSSTVHTVP